MTPILENCPLNLHIFVINVMIRGEGTLHLCALFLYKYPEDS